MNVEALVVALIVAMWADLRYQGYKTRDELDKHIADRAAHL